MAERKRRNYADEDSFPAPLIGGRLRGEIPKGTGTIGGHKGYKANKKSKGHANSMAVQSESELERFAKKVADRLKKNESSKPAPRRHKPDGVELRAMNTPRRLTPDERAIYQALGPSGGAGGGAAVDNSNIMALIDKFISQLPTIDRNQYVKPYDDATAAARWTAAEADNSIKANYKGLGGTLDRLEGDWRVQTNDDMADMKAAHQQLLAENQKFQQAGMNSLQAQGVTTPELMAQSAQAGGEQQAALHANVANNEGTARAFQRIQEQSMRERQADVPAMQAASSANASNNLQALLQQIGMGKAEAEREFAQDSAQRQQEIAKMRLDAEMALQEAAAQGADPREILDLNLKRLELVEKQQKMLREADPANQERLRPDGKPMTGQDDFWLQRMREIQGKYKQSSQFLADALGNNGDYPSARAYVFNPANIELAEEELGVKINPAKIDEWLKEYYFGQGQR